MSAFSALRPLQNIKMTKSHPFNIQMTAHYDLVGTKVDPHSSLQYQFSLPSSSTSSSSSSSSLSTAGRSTAFGITMLQRRPRGPRQLVLFDAESAPNLLRRQKAVHLPLHSLSPLVVVERGHQIHHVRSAPESQINVHHQHFAVDIALSDRP